MGPQDERFSYVILRRGPRPLPTYAGQVHVRPPHDQEDEEHGIDSEPDVGSAGPADDALDDLDGVDDAPRASAAAMQLAVARAAVGWPRVMRPPRRRSRHVVLDLCTPAGALEQRTVAVSHYRLLGPGTADFVRRLRWGDQWPFPDPKKEKDS